LKVLATPSQPFELRLQRATGPAEWPWLALFAWVAACTLGAAALWLALRSRDAQRRQAELMRMAQVGRLNTLSELAAGVAHELNQPLAAVLASTQAAQRLLRPDGSTEPEPPGPEQLDLPSLRQALDLAAGQAKRASGVLTRLRRLVQNPMQSVELQAVDLHALCLQMLDLLRPELQRRGISAEIRGNAPAAWADPVMVEQIIHNLISNAMQALEGANTAAPHISLHLQQLPEASQALLRVRDNGPGFQAEQLDHIFEPFFSTRAGGLGLGLPLCETLAEALGGKLQARQAGSASDSSTGAELLLTLPLAKPGQEGRS
jgi:signal transduction histidine kinase